MVSAFRRGLSEAKGSWKIICTRLRNARKASPRACVTSVPSMRITPALGSIRRKISLPTVDFPQPDSPTRQSVSPRASVKLTPSTARKTRPGALQQAAAPVSKCFARPSTSRSGLLAGGSSRGDAHAAARSATKQATPWPGAISAKRGLSRRQRSSASAQRGAKAQPVISSRSDGTSPRISASRFPATAHAAARRRRHQPLRIGMGGMIEERLDRGFLDLAARHT